MSPTALVKATITARAHRDRAFSDALLTEGLNALLGGDFETGKAVLGDYIGATIGFDALAAAIGTPPHVLRRGFSAAGRPNASTVCAVIRELQRHSGMSLRVCGG